MLDCNSATTPAESGFTIDADSEQSEVDSTVKIFHFKV